MFLEFFLVLFHLGKNLADFGAKWPNSQEGARKYLPRLIINDGFNTHQGWLSLFDQSNYRFGSTVNWTRGRHNIKFGGEAQRSNPRVGREGHPFS